MNLTSYAELAVRLVNTAFRANGDPDPLGATDAFRMLISDHAHLSGALTPADLEAMRALRDELAAVFTAAATGRDHQAIERLNALLVRFPIQPVLVGHDDQRWHVHLAEAGSVSDRYAAGAVIGLTLMVSQFGLSRLGICSIAACQQVFIDGSPNRSRRYCPEHSATRTNVTTIRAEGGSHGDSRARTAAS